MKIDTAGSYFYLFHEVPFQTCVVYSQNSFSKCWCGTILHYHKICRSTFQFQTAWLTLQIWYESNQRQEESKKFRTHWVILRCFSNFTVRKIEFADNWLQGKLYNQKDVPGLPKCVFLWITPLKNFSKWHRQEESLASVAIKLWRKLRYKLQSTEGHQKEDVRIGWANFDCGNFLRANRSSVTCYRIKKRSTACPRSYNFQVIHRAVNDRIKFYAARSPIRSNSYHGSSKIYVTKVGTLPRLQ